MQIKINPIGAKSQSYKYKVEGAQLTVYFTCKRDAVDFSRKLSKHYTKVFTDLVDIYSRLLIKSYKGQYSFDSLEIQELVSNYILYLSRSDKQTAGQLRFLYYHLTRLDSKRINAPMMDVNQLPQHPKGRMMYKDAYVKQNELRYNF